MKMKSKAILLGAFAVIGSCLLFANGKNSFNKGDRALNSILDTGSAPIFKTAYTSAAAAPVDFEKAASAAVPSVVHIKTMTRSKQMAEAQREMPGQGQDQ